MTDQFGLHAPSRRNIRNLTILLIDDNLDHCNLIRKVLQASMPEVDLLIATTVEQVMPQLNLAAQTRQTYPRLILLDLYVPQREDGWALLQALKEPTSPYRLIPVTVLSQSAKPEDVQKSYDLGVNSYITKPVDYPQWISYFESLRQYWLYTVTLPIR